MKGIAILANFFVPEVGSFIVGKIGQGIGQIVIWGVDLLLTLGTLGIGGIIGIPLMLCAWIWTIVTAAGGPVQAVLVNIVDSRERRWRWNMSGRVLSVCLAIFLTFPLCLLPQRPLAQSEYPEANKLFVEAVKIYNASSKLPDDERDQAYAKVSALLERITTEYPNSRPAKAIQSDGPLGGIDIGKLPPKGIDRGQDRVENVVSGEAADVRRYENHYRTIDGDQIKEKVIAASTWRASADQRSHLFDLLVRVVKNDENLSNPEKLSVLLAVMEQIAASIGQNAEIFEVLNYARNIHQSDVDYAVVKNPENGWIGPVPDDEKEFHTIGIPNPDSVEKYIHHDGREAVFLRTPSGEIMHLKDGTNDATFNFVPNHGRNPLQKAKNSYQHMVLDVIPWLVYGVSPTDSTTISDRISAFEKSSIIRELQDLYSSIGSVPFDPANGDGALPSDIYVELAAPNGFLGPPKLEKLIEADSLTQNTVFFEPEKGTELREQILDAVRVIAAEAYGVPIEFVVESLRVSEQVAYANLFAQKRGGADINIQKSPAFLRGDIDLLSGDPNNISAILTLVDGSWNVKRHILAASEAWWLDDCEGLNGVLPETCQATNTPVGLESTRVFVTDDSETEKRQVSGETGEANSPLGEVSLNISAGFFDPGYPRVWSPPAQHLGVDLPAPADTQVSSPINGRVKLNRTARADPFQKYLIIKDKKNGFEHVFGHIDSPLVEGGDVEINDPLGKIVASGTGPHLHWGINKNSILETFGEDWGWGRAPVTSTRNDALAKGWIDPENWFGDRSAEPKPLGDKEPTRDLDRQVWLEVTEPTITLRSNQNTRSFFGSKLSVNKNSAVIFSGFRVFNSAPVPDLTELRGFLSPNKDAALIFQVDLDWGAVRAAVISKTASRTIRKSLIPENRVWGRGKPDQVAQPILPLSWSPDGNYAAFPMSSSEWQADLAVVDLLTGQHVILAPDELGSNSWAFPNMKALKSVDGGRLELKYDVLACSDTDCTGPQKTGEITASYKISDLFGPKLAEPTTVAEKPGRTEKWGPSIVPEAGIELGYRPCGDRTDIRRCLEDKGLSKQAIDFSFAVSGDLKGEVFATEFKEAGAIDVVHVIFNGASPQQWPVLVNGTVKELSLEGTNNLAVGFTDPSSQKMLRKFPRATSRTAQVRSHRLLGDGTQRFALVETIIDGCRACPIIGSAVTFLEIAPATGGVLKRRPVGLLLTDPKDDVDLTAGVLQDRPASLQAMLNILGYDAGEMDGSIGPQTRRALRNFQAEHCLPMTGQVDERTTRVLLAADGFDVPCAEGIDAHKKSALKTAEAYKSAQSEILPATQEREFFQVSSKVGAVVRSAGSMEAKEVTRLPFGTIVEFVKWHNGYRQVLFESDGRSMSGFIWHHLLRAIDKTELDRSATRSGNSHSLDRITLALNELNKYAFFSGDGFGKEEVFFKHSISPNDCVLKTRYYRMEIEDTFRNGTLFTIVTVKRSEVPLRSYDFSKSALAKRAINFVLERGATGISASGIFSKTNYSVDDLEKFGDYIFEDGLSSDVWFGNRGHHPNVVNARSGTIPIVPYELRFDEPEARSAFDKLVNACKA